MDRIINVSMPSTVRGGQPFEVTVDYSADEDGKLEIYYRGTFDGEPDTVALAAHAQRTTFPVVIVRYGTAPICRVEFKFGNRWLSLVEVT